MSFSMRKFFCGVSVLLVRTSSYCRLMQNMIQSKVCTSQRDFPDVWDPLIVSMFVGTIALLACLTNVLGRKHITGIQSCGFS